MINFLFRGFQPVPDGSDTFLDKGINDKSKEKGVWVYGDLITQRLSGVFIEYKDAENQHHLVNVLPESVGVYINKKDKNGNKIFTGQYIVSNDALDSNELYQVSFSKGEGMFKFYKPSNFYWYNISDLLSEFIEVVEGT